MLSIPRPLPVPKAAGHRHAVFFVATISQIRPSPPPPHTLAAGGATLLVAADVCGHLFLSVRSAPPPNAPDFLARRAVGSRRRCAWAWTYSFLVPSVQPASTVACSVSAGLAAASSAAFLAASAASRTAS